MTDLPAVSVDNLPSDSLLTEVLGNRDMGGGIAQTVRVPVQALANLLAPFGSHVVFATKADMDGNLAYPANTGGEVWADSTSANNGIYRKAGASGSGSWIKVANHAVADVESRLDGVDADLSAEITNRQNAVNGEAAARATAVANEALARAAADTAEANARAAAVTGEANARAAAISSEAAARVAGDKAGLDSLLLNIGRPGDRPDLFTYELTGFPDATAALSAANVVTVADGGRVYRLTGGSIVARRAMWRIEPGRRYRLRGVLRRVANVLGSPSDTVAFGVQAMTASAGDISRPDLGANFSALAVGQRVTADVVVSTVAGAGVDAVLPSTAVYVRPYWWINTTTCTNDIESVEDIIDVTDYGVLTPDLTGLTSRVAGIESQQPFVVSQVLAAQAAAEDALEQAQAANAAPSISYDTLAELQASAPPGGGSWSDGVIGYVLTGPDVGSYIRDSGVAGNWRFYSADTLPSVAARTAALEAPLARLEDRPPTADITAFADKVRKRLMWVNPAGQFDFLPQPSLARKVAEAMPADAETRVEQIEISSVSIDDERPVRPIILDGRDGSGRRRRILGVNREGQLVGLFAPETVENISADLAPLSPVIGRADARIPNRNDDGSRRYAVGSIWPHEKHIWQCLDNTNGYARWRQKARPALAGSVVTSGLNAVYALRRAVPGYTGKCLRVKRLVDPAAPSVPAPAEIDLYFLPSGRLDVDLARDFSGDWSVPVYVIEYHEQTGAHGPMVWQASYGGQTWDAPLLTPFDYLGSDPAIYFPSPFSGNGSVGVYTGLVIPSTITGSTRSVSAVCLGQFVHITTGAPIFQLTTATVSNSLQFLFSDNSARRSLTIGSANFGRGFSDTYKPPNNRPGVYGMTSGGSGTAIYAEDDLVGTYSIAANDTFTGGIYGATTYPLSGGVPSNSGYTAQGAILFYNRALSAAEMRAVMEALYADFNLPRQTRGGVIVVGGDSIARAPVQYSQGWFQYLFKGLGNCHRLYNAAMGGSTFRDQLAAVPNWQGAFDPAASFNISIAAWGSNDIALDRSKDEIHTDAVAMIAAQKAANPWYVPVQTVIPRGGFSIGSREAVRLEWNDHLRANWRAMGADFLVDMAADPVMGALDWFTDPLKCIDSTHPTGYGQSLMAPVYSRAIDAFLRDHLGIS